MPRLIASLVVEAPSRATPLAMTIAVPLSWHIGKIPPAEMFAFLTVEGDRNGRWMRFGMRGGPQLTQCTSRK